MVRAVIAEADRLPVHAARATRSWLRAELVPRSEQGRVKRRMFPGAGGQMCDFGLDGLQAGARRTAGRAGVGGDALTHGAREPRGGGCSATRAVANTIISGP
jgi:hypothetical protein